MILKSKSRTIQLTLDNCDTKSNNCTVAFVQTETVDTSHLGTEPMSPEETLSLFDLNLLDLNRPEHQPEKEHLRSVILLALGRELAKFKPELSHWLKVLPEHHDHPNAGLPLEQALLTLLSPLPYQVK